MSLKVAVEMIVEEMESVAISWIDTDDLNNVCAGDRLKGLARQLRIALKASEHAPPLTPLPNSYTVPLPPAAQHAQMIEEARREFRKEGIPPVVKQLREEEQEDPRMVECVDGPFDGTIQPCNPSMPEGAFCKVGNQIYKLSSGRLVYQPST